MLENMFVFIITNFCLCINTFVLVITELIVIALIYIGDPFSVKVAFWSFIKHFIAFTAIDIRVC